MCGSLGSNKDGNDIQRNALGIIGTHMRQIRSATMERKNLQRRGIAARKLRPATQGHPSKRFRLEKEAKAGRLAQSWRYVLEYWWCVSRAQNTAVAAVITDCWKAPASIWDEGAKRHLVTLDMELELGSDRCGY